MLNDTKIHEVGDDKAHPERITRKVLVLRTSNKLPVLWPISLGKAICTRVQKQQGQVTDHQHPLYHLHLCPRVAFPLPFLFMVLGLSLLPHRRQ